MLAFVFAGDLISNYIMWKAENLPTMNSSRKAAVENKSYFTITAIISVLWGFVFFSNERLFCILTKLILSLHAKKYEYGISIHTFFVNLNDAFSGFVLFLLGVVKVNIYISTHVLCVLDFIEVCFSNFVSCICARRYILSRHLRKTKMYWNSAYTHSLIVVNIIVDAASFAAYRSVAQVK